MGFNNSDGGSLIVEQPVYQTIMQATPEEVQTFFPAVLGSTSNPTAVVYTRQYGKYVVRGKWCQFVIDIVTSSITKPTALTDVIQISLPLKAANNGVQSRFSGVAYNSIPIQTANSVLLMPDTQFLSLQQYSLGSTVANLTFGLLTGIGALTNNITFQASGHYEIA